MIHNHGSSSDATASELKILLLPTHWNMENSGAN